MIRKPLLILFAPLLFSCSVTHPPAGMAALKTAPKVDVGRYSGKWYELARFPQWFQKDCASATAEYAPVPGGKIRVVNTCIRKDGSRRSITGSAEPVDASANRLRVTFSESWAARLVPVPENGNYWIIHVTPGYQQAIVGTPDRKSLWFLSRSPAIPRTTFERLKKIAAEEGFDTATLVIDEHTRIVE